MHVNVAFSATHRHRRGPMEFSSCEGNLIALNWLGNCCCRPHMTTFRGGLALVTSAPSTF